MYVIIQQRIINTISQTRQRLIVIYSCINFGDVIIVIVSSMAGSRIVLVTATMYNNFSAASRRLTGKVINRV